MSLGNFIKMMVILASLLLLGGLIVFLGTEGYEKPQYQVFHEKTTSPIHGQALMKTGLLLIGIAPFCTLIFCAALYGIKKDILYLVMTLIVMAILLSSLYVPWLPHL